MAPRVLEHPGTRPTDSKGEAVDKRILAHRAHPSSTDQEQEGNEECNCFYCLEGWVFLSSLDHDGQEVCESVRCRRCGGTGRKDR